jgi:lysozyme family protein
MGSIQSDHFNKALLMLLEETFEQVHGFYLDKGTSLFETLAAITAEQASILVGGKCATLAAQVTHVAYYLDVLEKSVRESNFAPVDWDEIWRTVSQVDAEQWQAIQADLRSSYAHIQELVKTTTDWPSEREIGGAIAMIAHTAYHLGEIRQAMCVLK